MFVSIISLVISLFIMIAISSFTIIAIITQKNWATITLISCSVLTIASVCISYLNIRSIPSDSMKNFITFCEIAGPSLPVIFVAAIIGYIHKSKPIYDKAISLQKENETLANKLNQNQS